MLGEKRPRKIKQVWDNAVVRISPKRRKLKAIAGFAADFLRNRNVTDSVTARRIGVILRVCPIGYDKYLDIFKESTSSPEAISLVSVNLVKCLLNRDSPPLQLDVDSRKPVNQDCDIVSIAAAGTFFGANFILVDDLQAVVMNMVLIQQSNIFRAAIVLAERLYIVFLETPCFLYNSVFVWCNAMSKEPIPFTVAKLKRIQFFNFTAKIFHKVIFRVNGKILIALFAELPDKLCFQFGFTLVGFRTAFYWFVLRHNRIFICGCDNVKITHFFNSSKDKSLSR